MLVAELFEKRISRYRRFKNLLMEQQKALLKGDSSQLHSISQQQLCCLEEIQKLEMQWQSWLKAEKVENSGAISQWTNLQGNVEISEQVEAYQEQLSRLWKEIEQLRDSNRLLIENSLDFISALLNQVKNGFGNQVGYHPLERPAATNLIVNKKI